MDEDGVLKVCQLPSGAAGNAGDTIGGTAGMSGASGETSGGGGGDVSEVCPEGGANGSRNEGPLPAPWKTSFEAGFCNYTDDGSGFCYADPDSSQRLVSSPVHSGSYAAAFDMDPSSSGSQRQTRCVRGGVLPVEAYYGAWYYVPSDLAGASDWNLFHFQGGQPRSLLHALWDVSMEETPGIGLVVYIYDARQDGHYGQAEPKAIPRDRWFHLEFYLKRAADATGEVALYQDGEEVVRRTGIITDDSPFGEWYVGNWAAELANTPSTVSVYVDDVTVRLP